MILTLYVFLAQCTAINNSEDCCSSINLCGLNQGNCKSDNDCQGDLTCEDTCPVGFPDGYKCCQTSGKFIFDPLEYSPSTVGPRISRWLGPKISKKSR